MPSIRWATKPEMTRCEPYSQVFLVMDEGFGEKAMAYAEIAPIWLIQSPLNVDVVRQIWEFGSARFPGSPTYFDPLDHLTREDRVAEAIWTMDDHHSEWWKFEVISHPLTDKILKAFEECAPGYAETTSKGFVFHRTGPRVQASLTCILWALRPTFRPVQEQFLSRQP